MADVQPQNRITLPAFVSDPVWSLCPWPLVVQVGRREVVIPPVPAADWLRVLMAPTLNLDGVFPGLLGDEDREWIDDLIFSEKISLDDLAELQLAIISEATGRPWYISLRLVSLTKMVWDKVAFEILANTNAATASIAGWIDVAYLSILKGMEQNKVQMFLSKLEAPPVGFATEDPQELEMSAGAFMALGG